MIRSRPHKQFIAFLTGSGKIDPTCSLNITPAADPNDNGGHLHDAATRPLGTVAPSTGMGQITFVYSAPLASGTVNLVVTGVSSYGAAIAPYTYKMQVKTSGLQAMPPGGGYSLIGATGIHPDNHYGTPELITALQGLASDYAAAFPGSTLNYNDMALQEGGVFDLSSTWAPPHCGHRGDNADLDTSNIPADRRARVQALANHNGLAVRDEIRTANHYHLSR